jgi:hypothetical protein
LEATQPAVADLKHLDEKVREHEDYAKHLKHRYSTYYVRDSKHGVTAKQGPQTTKAPIRGLSGKYPSILNI